MSISSNWHIFVDSEIEKTPASSGVYGLYQGSTTIYYGKAEGTEGIIGRLKSHKTGNEGYCTKSAEYFNYELCGNPSTRERELLSEHRNLWGSLPRCNNIMP
jgi:hypothetical protein